MESATPHSDIVVSLATQIQTMAERKPVLKEILDAFMGIMMTGAELRTELAALSAPSIVRPDPTRLSAGVPLLFDVEFQERVPGLTAGVKKMLTAVGTAFPPLKADGAKLFSSVVEDSKAPAAWLRMLLRNEDAPLRKLAEEVGLEPDVLRIELKQVFKPYLQWLAHGLARHVEGIAWDRGYCPICGAYPDTSFLKKGEAEQEFLMAHGSQRWLHCALCSYEWRLRRIHCPYCGTEDADSLEYLAAKETPHEKVYVCHKCNKYLTCLDTSELIEKPPSDLIPFELLHLDIIARQKGFTPLNRGHWNSMAV
ncbi:MAG: formate dehydrogenase accessory protein FdhE [Deltaproteobacteria bacterium]|nr:formate dehydrogenase accessory protein FdhE [Deltaproteobacteria bacterium]